MMKCTELAKMGNKSVVEIRDTETDQVKKYVVCADFNNAKKYGNKWSYGEYFNVEPTLGLKQEQMLKAAMFDLYGIEDPNDNMPTYDRLIELIREILAIVPIEDISETLKNSLNMTEEEAEFFGVKDKLFKRKYKIVDVTFRREQEITVKVVMPEDEDDYNAENYVENQDYLDDCADIESDDWYCDGYELYQGDMDEDEADDFIGRHEVWNGDDFPDYIN